MEMSFARYWREFVFSALHLLPAARQLPKELTKNEGQKMKRNFP